TNLDGTVERRLDGIGGVVAIVPADQVDHLRAADGVRQVSADRPVHLTENGWDSSGDAGSLPRTVQSVNATTPAASQATGKGIDVAVIDSGISPVVGLNTTPNKVVNGPDISFDSQPTARD